MKNCIMKRLLAVVLICSLFLSACGTSGQEDFGDTTNNSDGNVTPDDSGDSSQGTDTHQFYESTFEASGTAADIYNENMQSLLDGFVSFYADELDKVTGYDEPITVSMAQFYSATEEDAMAKWGEMYGETMEYNRWHDAIKQLYNVDVEYAWLAQAGEYTNKLRLDMTADDLPDIFLVETEEDVAQLAESGAIWDLTELYEQYATQDLLDIWNSDEGRLQNAVTFDGQIYGLPVKQPDTDNFSYLWIRSDWMEELGLEYPTTIDELTKIIDAFVNADFDGNGQKDTVGIHLEKTLYAPTRGLFSAFAAYPQNWVEKDGVLEWGGISENNKEALSVLSDWYQKGYISTEWITQDETTALESVLSGKCGVVYGRHGMAHRFGDLHENDPDSDWVAIELPTGTGEAVMSPLISVGRGWIVVNSDFEHPEIAFKLMAVMRAAINCARADWWIYEDNTSGQFSPVRTIVSSWDNLITYQNLQEVYENNDDTSLLRGKAVPYWANLHGENQWEWELMFGPGEHTAMSVLEDSYESDRLFYDAFNGVQSMFMQDRWSTITDEQLIVFTKIIVGEFSVEEGFAQWLESFQSMGGEEITQEVNEWYQSQ